MKNSGAMKEVPLVDREYLLEKSPGKGGWTYTIIPEITPDPHSPFGWVKVKGSIDGFEIRKYHLMPSGQGDLMLFVKAEIRKKIKKGAGDYVHIILYPDYDPQEIPDEFLLCLQDDAEALKFFNSLSDNQQQKFVKWIYSAKTEQSKVDRMAKAIGMLADKEKM